MSLLDSILGEIVLKNKTNLVLKTGGFCFNINITSNAHNWLVDKSNKVKILTYVLIFNNGNIILNVSDNNTA